MSLNSIAEKLELSKQKYYKLTELPADCKMRKYTDEEDKMIIEHQENDHELALKLKRSQRSIEARRHLLKARGVKINNPQKKHHLYSPSELELIADQSNTIEYLANKIGVSKSAIANTRYKYKRGYYN